MVYLTGDTHGELDRFKEGGLRRAGKGDFVVVLGDFGFGVGRQQGRAEESGLAAQAALHHPFPRWQPREL